MEELVTGEQEVCTVHACFVEVIQIIIFENAAVSLLDPLKNLLLIPSRHLLDCGDCR